MRKNIIPKENIQDDTQKKSYIKKSLFFASVLLLAMPSIIYWIKNGTIVGFHYDFTWLLKPNETLEQANFNAICFVSIFILTSICYISIVKSHKTIFKKISHTYLYIGIISIIFAIMVPFTTRDIFYYTATGWAEAHYNINPWYTTVKDLTDIAKDKENNQFTQEQKQEIQQDEILKQMPGIWANQVNVYGPLWPFICRILTTLSGGSLDIAIFLFKFVAIVLHLINVYLIYKITHKKFFVLLYGLNPFILFEAIANVHNDIYVITFILGAMYSFVKKKNIWLTLFFLALATSIKYVAILLAPFLVIYYLKEETIGKRILHSIKYAIFFIGIVFAFYLLYARDLQVLEAFNIQQGKISKSWYILVYMYLDKPFAFRLGRIVTGMFIGILGCAVINILCKKNIELKKVMKQYHYILLLFIFVAITNFQCWYIMWLFPTLMWQNKKNIKNVIRVSILSEIAMGIYFALGEVYTNDNIYYLFMVGTLIILNIFDYIDLKKVISKINNKYLKLEK